MALLPRLGLLSLALLGCRPEPSPPLPTSDPAPSVTASQAPASPPEALAPSAQASAVTSAPTAKELAPLTRDEKGLLGKTIDFSYDGKDVNDKTRAYTGRIFVHDKALRAPGPVPLVIFLHGLNRALIPHRWLGGGTEGDVRLILQELMESGAVPPLVLAGPGSVEEAAVSFGASFPVWDHDKFVAQVVEHLGEHASIDPSRVIVTGHSGAGCSDKGGLVAAVKAKAPPYAVVSIDTCMPGVLAEALGKAPPKTHVIVTWQAVSWDRDFKLFRQVFEKHAKQSPPQAGVLRELDKLPALPRAHDATVKQTFDKWLPKLLPLE